MTCEWTLYGITFDPNGGTGTPTTQTAYDKTATLQKNSEFAKFTRDGYTLTGWSTAKNGDVECTDGGSYTFPDDTYEVTLYAQWTPQTYQITVTSDPAEGGTASADKKEAAQGNTVTLSVTPNDGYEFVEWVPVTEGVTIKNGKLVMPASDVEVKATFKKKQEPVATCTVSFDANGGSGSMDPVSGTKGSEVTLPANAFARDGHAFKGWNTAKDGSGTAYADKAKLTLASDVTLYAQWEKGADPTNPSTDPTKPSTDPAKPNNTGTSTTPKAHATPTTSTPKTALPKTTDESSAPLAASLVGIAALCFLAARSVKRA